MVSWLQVIPNCGYLVQQIFLYINLSFCRAKTRIRQPSQNTTSFLRRPISERRHVVDESETLGIFDPEEADYLLFSGIFIYRVILSGYIRDDTFGSELLLLSCKIVNPEINRGENFDNRVRLLLVYCRQPSICGTSPSPPDNVFVRQRM